VISKPQQWGGHGGGRRKERRRREKKKHITYSTTLIHETNTDSCTQVVEEQEIKTN